MILHWLLTHLLVFGAQSSALGAPREPLHVLLPIDTICEERSSNCLPRRGVVAFLRSLHKSGLKPHLVRYDWDLRSWDGLATPVNIPWSISMLFETDKTVRGTRILNIFTLLHPTLTEPEIEAKVGTQNFAETRQRIEELTQYLRSSKSPFPENKRTLPSIFGLIQQNIDQKIIFLDLLEELFPDLYRDLNMDRLPYNEDTTSNRLRFDLLENGFADERTIVIGDPEEVTRRDTRRWIDFPVQNRSFNRYREFPSRQHHFDVADSHARAMLELGAHADPHRPDRVEKRYLQQYAYLRGWLEKIASSDVPNLSNELDTVPTYEVFKDRLARGFALLQRDGGSSFQEAMDIYGPQKAVILDTLVPFVAASSCQEQLTEARPSSLAKRIWSRIRAR